MHGRSGMTTDPRLPAMPRRSTSGFRRQGRQYLYRARKIGVGTRQLVVTENHIACSSPPIHQPRRCRCVKQKRNVGDTGTHNFRGSVRNPFSLLVPCNPCSCLFFILLLLSIQNGRNMPWCHSTPCTCHHLRCWSVTNENNRESEEQNRKQPRFRKTKRGSLQSFVGDVTIDGTLPPKFSSYFVCLP